MKTLQISRLLAILALPTSALAHAASTIVGVGW